MRFALVIASLLVFATSLRAQPVDPPVPMEFPADGVELRTLIDIVSRTLKIPIVYDESVNNKKVVIRVPKEVPQSALLGVLHGALRMKQLALVDADQPGWKQIVPASNIAAIARAVGPGQEVEPGMPVTAVINLKQADPNKIVETVRPFLTLNAGNILPASGMKAVIVSDYGAAVKRIEEIIKHLDEGSPVEVKFVPIKHADPAAAAQMVEKILTARDGAGTLTGISLTADERTGQLVVIAPKARMEEITTLLAGVDTPLELDTKVYRFKSVSPDRVDRLIKSLIGTTAAKRAYQSSIDKESQSLVVSATPDVHKRLDDLVKELDKPIDAAASPVRFYRLKNTKAADVLATLSTLVGEGATVVNPSGGAGDATGVGNSLAPIPTAPLDDRLPVRPGARDMIRDDAAGVIARTTAAGRPRADELGPLASENANTMSGGTAARPRATSAGRTDESGDVEGGDKVRNATVTADVNSNAIIVIAPPEVQETYAKLIAQLDTRRPQVQIECTIVTLDTSNDFSFGVDVSKLGGSGDDNRLIAFSSFGVSTVNPITAALTPIGRAGGTFAVLSPGNANIVIRALESNTRARLMSAPSLLVNDNGKGKLQSVNQEPFAEILDTSTTQSRTGLGGLAQAGTTITVEPHISEDDYLQLAYSIELSSFTGASRQGLPPPSQKNAVDSTVTIPDGYTIVVGGLTTKNFRETVDSIPFINMIPFADWVFGSRAKNTRDLTLFVFIRPVILRDDKFADLKYYSDKAAEKAGLPDAYPKSEPIPLK